MTHSAKIFFVWISISLCGLAYANNDNVVDIDVLVEQAYSYYHKEQYKEAYQIFQSLAEKENPKAQFALGAMFTRGQYVAVDYKKASEWYTKSANQGHAMAQFSLGVIYEYGEGVEQDYLKAIEWYKKSANQGHSGAQFGLGSMYQSGYGVIKQDYLKAIEWYTKSAKQGHVGSQEFLSRIYANGEGGVDINYKKAYVWNCISLKTTEFVLARSKTVNPTDYEDFILHLKTQKAEQEQLLSAKQIRQAQVEVDENFEYIEKQLLEKYFSSN